MARGHIDATGPPHTNADNMNGDARPVYALRTPSGSAVNGTKGNFHSMDPDEIFAKYTVHDVKSVLHKLRLDVDAKQEELRLMVGERYRDLLQASTSIIAMSDSSMHVVSIISEIKRTVGVDYNLAANSARTHQSGNDTQLQILQSLAAHLKLLLDASEHLWRLLERKKYFQAAWLFLLSRVVYRSVSGEGSGEDSMRWETYGINVKEQFPIAQRQWENLAPFRTQISHKATLSLRELTMTSNEVCNSLLGLHLLDSLPLSDALEVLLKQRFRSLQLLFDSIENTWHTTQPSITTDRTGKKMAKQVWDVLKNVLDAITNTVGAAREVFREASGGKSVIKQALEATQIEDKTSCASSPPAELRLSTQTLLSSLPNSNYFLALPSEVRYYRPFVDLQSSSSAVSQSVLDGKLQDWFKKAITQLRGVVPSWLVRLETIRSVWDVQASAWKWLSSPNPYVEEEDQRVLRALVGDVCIKRIEQIWQSALKGISATFDVNLRSSLTAVGDMLDDSRLDISPADFLLSAPPVPTITNISLGASHANTSFDRYKHAIGYRLNGMTPLLEKIVTTLEAAAVQLRDDSECVMTDLSYRHQLEGLFASSSSAVVAGLLSTLEKSLHEDEDDSDRSTRRIAFMGRLADKLSSSSTASDMRCSPECQSGFASRARELHQMSVKSWSTRVTSSVAGKLLTPRHPARAASSTNSGAVSVILPSSLFLMEDPLAMPNGSSPAIMDALFSLTGAMQAFGAFSGQEKRETSALSVFEEFVRAISTAINDKTNVTAQDYYDLYFLKMIGDEWSVNMSPTIIVIETTLERVRQQLPETQLVQLQDVPTSIANTLPHVRLLLSPLMPPQKGSPGNKSIAVSPALEMGKHRSGNSGLEHDVQPILNLVKPSARFGSLWVGTSVSS